MENSGALLHTHHKGKIYFAVVAAINVMMMLQCLHHTAINGCCEIKFFHFFFAAATQMNRSTVERVEPQWATTSFGPIWPIFINKSGFESTGVKNDYTLFEALTKSKMTAIAAAARSVKATYASEASSEHCALPCARQCKILVRLNVH